MRDRESERKTKRDKERDRERQTDRHRETETERQTKTERQTDRDTDRERQADRDRQTNRQRRIRVSRLARWPSFINGFPSVIAFLTPEYEWLCVFFVNEFSIDRQNLKRNKHRLQATNR